MCGRYALHATPSKLIEYFGLDDCAEFEPRFNIPPGTNVPVIRRSPEGKRVLHLLRWGLVPHWAKDPSIGSKLNNARGETVAEKPSFRDAFRRRRCLVPADGFYEWQAQGKIKQPFYISLKSGEPLAMGGLWESWKAPDGSLLRTVCIVTTGPNDVMAPIHDRMPVILSPDNWNLWLEGTEKDVSPLLNPCPPEGMQAWAVDRRVSKTAEDDQTLTSALA